MSVREPLMPSIRHLNGANARDQRSLLGIQSAAEVTNAFSTRRTRRFQQWWRAPTTRAFIENSPNNSSADAAGDIVVPDGTRIPGISRQT